MPSPVDATVDTIRPKLSTCMSQGENQGPRSLHLWRRLRVWSDESITLCQHMQLIRDSHHEQ
jgi:hypothetical protein